MTTLDPKQTPPPFMRGWGFLFILLMLAPLTAPSCAFTKAVTRDPANRSTVYGTSEAIETAIKTALEDHHYSVESSDMNQGLVIARSPASGSPNQMVSPEGGYQGYQLKVTLTWNRYGGRKLGFERTRISEVKTKKGVAVQSSEDAPDPALNRALIRQVSRLVMR